MDVVKMKIKKEFIAVMLLLWMFLIFLFSNQNITNSMSLSDKVASKIIDVVVKVKKEEIPPQEKAKMVKNTRLMIRKTAHFTEYFILGILVFKIFEIYGVQRALVYSIIFCFLYACSDELHQLFSDGRSAKVLDVLIDTSGSMLSIACFQFIKKRKLRIHMEKELN